MVKIKKSSLRHFLDRPERNTSFMESSNLVALFGRSLHLTSPPQGSVNVRLGNVVQGPGGKWVPCATEVSDGVYCSGLFEVGPGKRQVCVAGVPCRSPELALYRAIQIASTAAA